MLASHKAFAGHKHNLNSASKASTPGPTGMSLRYLVNACNPCSPFVLQIVIMVVVASVTWKQYKNVTCNVSKHGKTERMTQNADR